jgi:hypothetical protein
MTSIREPARPGLTQRPVAYLAVTSVPLLARHVPHPDIEGQRLDRQFAGGELTPAGRA